MNIISGKFDMTCALYAPIVATNSSSGEVTVSYSGTATATIFCYVNNRANNETFNDMQRQNNTTTTVDCRFNDIEALSVTNQWLMVVEGQTYQINSIVDAVEFQRRTVTRLSGIERLN
jgi:SPP1 family predicted phage head-tail adaptor